MYQSFFGMTQAPLGKESLSLWDNGQLSGLTQQFTWLLQSPGVGLLTAEPGLGKTAAPAIHHRHGKRHRDPAQNNREHMNLTHVAKC